MSETFEATLSARVDDMIDACTRCGKCVEACPVTTAAGVLAQPQAVVEGLIDILRSGDGAEDARKWASSCVQSGECIQACDYGVNPRFLIAMARVSMAGKKSDASERRRKGVEGFRRISRDANYLMRMQLDDALLERLGQKPAKNPSPRAQKPDFIFYTGCNVLKTPHIALLALDIMDALGVSYEVMGGPAHCCGVQQLRAGDTTTLGRVGEVAIDKLASGNGQVLAWCPSCYVQYTETTLPTVERMRGTRPFEMTPWMRFLGENIDRLKPFLKTPVNMRVALHRHPGVPGAMEAAEKLLCATSGVELVDLGQPGIGLMSNSLAAVPEHKRKLYRAELDAAQAANIDALLAVYHADHRELCAHEAEYDFRIMNVLEIVGESMGLHHDDHYKHFKLMQDIDMIAADCEDLSAAHGLDKATAREVIAAMLADQPVPINR